MGQRAEFAASTWIVRPPPGKHNPLRTNYSERKELMGRAGLWSVVLVGILLAWSVAACRKPAEPGVVAEFKGGRLTVDDLEAHRDLLRHQKTYRENPERLTKDFVFDHAVNMELIIAKGLKEKLHQDPRIRAEIHAFMSDLFLRLMQDKLVPQIDRSKVTEDELRAYFDAHPEAYRTPASYGLRVIRHPDPVVLEHLRRRIEAGQETFAAAAMQHSTDEETKGAGGYAGRRALDRFPSEWRPVIEALGVNEIARPVSLRDSSYLLQLVEKTEPRQFSYEDRKEFVLNDLLYSRYREQWRQIYEGLKKEFRLAVNDHELQHFIGTETGHEK